MDQFSQCLQHKTIYLLGDSTLRHWFKLVFVPQFECDYTSEKWTKEKWHKPSTCINKSLNLTVHWCPHSQPFSVGDATDDNKYTLYSIARRLDDLGAEENVFIVINVFLHNVPYHHNVFKTKMMLIKHSVEQLLRRNTKAQVFIKGPHTYEDTPSGNLRLNDWYAYVFTNILFDVFKDLQHKVIFLNNMDSTDALLVKFNHPPASVVTAMVNQMLTYVC